MLTSHTLKQALLNAARLREIKLEQEKKGPTTVDLEQSMKELMGSMTQRLKMYEKKERIRSRSRSQSLESIEGDVEDSAGSGAQSIEALQEENRRLKRCLTEQGLQVELPGS